MVNKAGLSDCACGCWCLMGGSVADLLYFPTKSSLGGWSEEENLSDSSLGESVLLVSEGNGQTALSRH